MHLSQLINAGAEAGNQKLASKTDTASDSITEASIEGTESVTQSGESHQDNEFNQLLQTIENELEIELSGNDLPQSLQQSDATELEELSSMIQLIVDEEGAETTQVGLAKAQALPEQLAELKTLLKDNPTLDKSVNLSKVPGELYIEPINRPVKNNLLEGSDLTQIKNIDQLIAKNSDNKLNDLIFSTKPFEQIGGREKAADLSFNELKPLSSQSSLNQTVNNESLIAMNHKVSQQSPLKPTEQPVNLYSKNWQGDFSRKINWMMSQGMEMADIELDPPELGPLTIKVTQTQVRFSTSRAPSTVSVWGLLLAVVAGCLAWTVF